jgi:hypothetical protein
MGAKWCESAVRVAWQKNKWKRCKGQKFKKKLCAKTCANMRGLLQTWRTELEPPRAADGSTPPPAGGTEAAPTPSADRPGSSQPPSSGQPPPGQPSPGLDLAQGQQSLGSGPRPHPMPGRAQAASVLPWAPAAVAAHSQSTAALPVVPVGREEASHDGADGMEDDENYDDEADMRAAGVPQLEQPPRRSPLKKLLLLSKDSDSHTRRRR